MPSTSTDTASRGPAPAAGVDRRLIRRLICAVLTESLGTGLFFTVALVYFVRHVGLAPTAAGLAMTVAGIVGVACAVPFGFLADMMSVRRMLAAAMTVQGTATLCYLGAASLVSFAAVACTVGLASQTVAATRGALVGTMFTGAAQVLARGRLRVTGNIGFGLGTVLGGLVLQADTPGGYRAAIAGTSVTLLSAAAVVLGLPEVRQARVRRERPPVRVLRDRRFLAVSTGNAVLCLHFGLFEVAMPLWIVSHTQAPRWLVAALLLLNSALVVLLQVRVGRRAGDVRQAARLVRLAGFLLLASTAAFATTGDLDAVPASVVLLGAATVYALGEVCHAAGGWALSYGLTDQELHGQYQGVFHAAEGIGIAVSPLVATGVVLQFAAPGWVAVGCLLAATGIVVARLSRQQDAAR